VSLVSDFWGELSRRFLALSAPTRDFSNFSLMLLPRVTQPLAFSRPQLEKRLGGRGV
jgi:hypothetical protein